MNVHSLKILLLLAAMLLPVAAHAQAVDAQIEGAKMCTRSLARYEREYGIPMHLLSAISATESGRYHEGLKITLPWPWTINVDGQGHYYDTKEEVIAATRRFQIQGARNIDVGCMQVSLLHHPEAFTDLNQAFDPEHNVAYGASFLRSLYEESKSWKQASANYHSKTPARGGEYVSRVFDRWNNIIDRLREAKAAIPASTEQALLEKDPVPQPVKLVVADEIQRAAPQKVASNARSTMRMNSISVKTVDTAARDQGILVIRPRITVADAADSVPVVADLQTARVIRVADTQTPSLPSGPRFIFDN